MADWQGMAGVSEAAGIATSMIGSLNEMADAGTSMSNGNVLSIVTNTLVGGLQGEETDDVADATTQVQNVLGTICDALYKKIKSMIKLS